ncbi:hypothetical protein ACPV3A_26935 [Paenibacillus sp. Dod16]|uniref:hypothetical protein n=1 Tax=Paenibacillus sp. Dod16 TaxID=3416392 RepID=UPI003CEB258D
MDRINTDPSTLVRDWIGNCVAEHRRTDEDSAAELYLAGYQLQQALGGREHVNKEFAKQLQEHSLTNQKEFTQLILTTYMDLDLTIPSCLSKTYRGYAYSQMFLLGLIGDKPKNLT